MRRHHLDVLTNLVSKTRKTPSMLHFSVRLADSPVVADLLALSSRPYR
jgi:hypothetical protein